MKEVSTSFLSDNDYIDLIKKLNNTSTDYIHFDVMDGKFVDNKNLSVSELCKLIDICKKKIDIHFMVSDPIKYIEKIALRKIDYITIHRELKNFDNVFNQAKIYGFKIGIAIKPETSIEEVIPYLKECNLILIMSVHPGKSGQKFIEDSINKVNELRKIINDNNLSVKISIDGGVNDTNLEYLKNADIIVSSSFILNDYSNIDLIRMSGSYEKEI